MNTGAAVVGNVGTEEQRSFAAIGDTINVAARLQAVAEPGQVVVSAATSAALPKDVELGGLGRRDVKGRDEPVEAYVVLS